MNAIRLFAQHYDELRRVAHHLRGRSASNTLTATGLVHEAYLHLHLHKDLTVQSKRHLLRLAACAMRQVLARHTRRSRAWKRGGRAAILPLPETAAGPRPPLLDVLMLDDALDALDRKHPRQARVVQCRFYTGLTVTETARVLGVSSATVKRDWHVARRWLMAHLSGPA